RAVLRHLDVEGTDEVEIGYAFYPEYWGRGLATEIAAACLAHGRRLGVPSLVAIINPENHASQRVLTKVGLAYERPARPAGRGVVRLFGVPLADGPGDPQLR